MFKFFRKIRQNLLLENKTGKYFKYAIGEIVLVVIGILIALQINNWNEVRKNHEKYLSIYTSVYADIANDLQDLKTNRDFFLQKKPLFKLVLNDSLTPELLDQGLSRLLGDGVVTSLNKSGVNQLKEIENKDSLSLAIINLYDLMQRQFITAEGRVNIEITEHAKYIRDNYDWYTEWISKSITKDNSSTELQTYFLKGKDYRNRVTSVYQQLYNGQNYIPSTDIYIERLTELKLEIKDVLTKNHD